MQKTNQILSGTTYFKFEKEDNSKFFKDALEKLKGSGVQVLIVYEDGTQEIKTL